MRTFRILATAVAAPLLLVACGSDSNPTPGGTTGSTTQSTDNGGRSFFNDTDGISFANTMGGGFSNALEAVLGGLGGSSSIASGSSLQARVARATSSESIACDGGGLISISSTTDDATGEPTAFGLSFSDCVIEGAVSNGSVNFAISGSETNQTITMSFNSFSSVEKDETNSINGTVSISVLSDQSNAFSTTISGSSLTMVSGGETITYSNYNLTSGQDGAGNTSVGGAATITAGGGTLTMTIDPALVTNTSSDYPETGTISWTHSDGSSLSIDADTGNAATFSYVISDGASTTSDIGLWADTDVGAIAL